MEDKIISFGNSSHNAEVAAQRLVLAALTGGFIQKQAFSTNEAGGKELAEFLGTATIELAKRLEAHVGKHK